jgi:hypothetical protein
LDITNAGLVQLPSKLPSGWKKMIITNVGPDKKNYSVQ